MQKITPRELKGYYGEKVEVLMKTSGQVWKGRVNDIEGLGLRVKVGPKWVNCDEVEEAFLV